MSKIIERLMSGGGAPRSAGILDSIAAGIGCETAVIAAVIAVESSGRGFDDRGRVKVLFEKHLFYQHLPEAKRKEAVKAGLARKSWISPKKGGYKDQPTNEAALALLARAAAFDETAALKSASYGAGQVLGKNFGLCGWSSVQAFVVDMAGGEDAHIRAIVGFIKGSGLADELRAKDFDAIARVYNGAGQVAVYGDRLRYEYKTLTGAAPVIASTVRAAGLRLGSKGYRVEGLQKRLIELGYPVVADGDFGPATRRAVIAFQVDHDLEVDGVVGPATQDALDKASSVIAPERENATVADLRQRGSETIKIADRSQALGGVVGGGAVVYGVVKEAGVDGVQSAVDGVQALAPLMGPARALLAVLADNWWLGAGILAVFIILYAHRLKAVRLQDHQTGRAA